MMNADRLTLADPVEMAETLAGRIRTLRLLRGWTQATLAGRAGVTTASYRRFETTGKASLELVLKAAHALACLDEFNQIFQPPPARSIEEMEKLAYRTSCRRGHL